MKFSAAQIKFLSDNGTVKGDKLTIPLTILEQSAPTRSRSSEEERQERFNKAIQDLTPQDDGSVVVSAIVLAESGLPEASVANPAYWSGIADGSRMAHTAGYKSKFVQRREGMAYVLQVVLTPLTEADRAAHQKRLTDAEQKAAAKKKKKNQPAEVQASDEGAPVQDDASEGADEGEASEE